VAEHLLLVGHGSRSTAGQEEMRRLTNLVREARPGDDVRLGFLELSEPPASRVIAEMLADGIDELAVVPLMLHAAGHSKSDVPAVVLEARATHPKARIAYARPFGVDAALLHLAHKRLADAGALGLPLAVLARGTSDPDANAEATKAGRLLAEMSGTELVMSGFSGVTWPSVPDSLHQLRHLGADRIAAFAWYMATGVLLDRMKEDFAHFTAETGVEVIDAGHFGAGPELAQLVLDRAAEARAGEVRMNCDTCSYRAPFPGFEARAGQALGVGHSHLAEEHRHQGHDHHHEVHESHH
jgi:sirohydrochlorin cobaltochelatase